MKLLLLATVLALAQAAPPATMADVGGHKPNVQVDVQEQSLHPPDRA